MGPTLRLEIRTDPVDLEKDTPSGEAGEDTEGNDILRAVLLRESST